MMDIPLIIGDPESTLRKVQERFSDKEWEKVQQLLADWFKAEYTKQGKWVESK